MREPNYQEVFSHSWQIIKEHKVLWIFGLLSICLGQWGLADFLGGLNLVGLNDFVPKTDWLVAMRALINVSNGGVLSTLLMMWLVLIGLAVFTLVIFVAVVSRGALIAAVGHWFAKKGKVSVVLVWRHGVKNFWKLLFLGVLTRALEIVFLLLAVVVFALCDNTAAGFVAQAFYGAFTLAIGMIVEAVSIFASGYIVIDSADVPSAVTRGWRLFTHHVLVTLELGVLLVALVCVFVLGLLVAGFLVFIPTFFVWALALLFNSTTLISVGAILANLLFVIVLALSAGIFNAFNTSAWMYLFVKMHRENYSGWLLHKIKKLFVK